MKFKIQKVELNLCSTEKKTNFHVQSERDSPFTYVLLQIYTPLPSTHTLEKVLHLVVDVFFLYPRNLDIIKYTKLTIFVFLLVPPSLPKKLYSRIYFLNFFSKWQTVLVHRAQGEIRILTLIISRTKKQNKKIFAVAKLFSLHANAIFVLQKPKQIECSETAAKI